MLTISGATIPVTFLILLVSMVLLASLVIFIVGFFIGKRNEADLWKRGRKASRAILGGVFYEQVAPFLPNFPKDLKASEARFIGKPIDFLIFKGMDEQNISEVVFVEVKTGKSQLTPNERKLKDAIHEKRVRWYEYRVDEGISKMTEESSASG